MLALTDPAATDPGVSGEKAAALARAIQRGYPVLRGAVVPIDVGRKVLALAHSAFSDGGERSARQCIAEAQLEIDWPAAVKIVGGSRTLVARSSTSLDADGRFAGTFSSFGGLQPTDLSTAFRGCLGSLFGRPARARLEHAGLGLDGVQVTMLVQPELAPSHGGWAATSGDVVEVAWTEGHPGPLTAGVVTGKRALIGDHPAADNSPVDVSQATGLVAAVSSLMRTAHKKLDARSIEWASDESGVWLFQLNAYEPASLSGLSHDRAPEPVTPTSSPVRGTSGAPGIAHGRVVELGRPQDIGLLRPGDIAVVDEPLNAYAPALWVASGLVARGGSAAAHLCHVARALRVPIVVDVDLPFGIQTITVDGSAGLVWTA